MGSDGFWALRTSTCAMKSRARSVRAARSAGAAAGPGPRGRLEGETSTIPTAVRNARSDRRRQSPSCGTQRPGDCSTGSKWLRKCKHRFMGVCWVCLMLSVTGDHHQPGVGILRFVPLTAPAGRVSGARHSASGRGPGSGGAGRKPIVGCALCPRYRAPAPAARSAGTPRGRGSAPRGSAAPPPATSAPPRAAARPSPPAPQSAAAAAEECPGAGPGTAPAPGAEPARLSAAPPGPALPSPAAHRRPRASPSAAPSRSRRL